MPETYVCTFHRNSKGMTTTRVTPHDAVHGPDNLPHILTPKRTISLKINILSQS